MTGAPPTLDAPARAGERPSARAWVIWGLIAGFYFYAFFQRVAPSVMVDDLMREFAVGAAILGNLSALYFYAYAVMQLPVGLIVDRWGARRTMAAAIALCGAGSLLFALAPSLGPAYAGRLLIGLGAAFSWVGGVKLIGIWFPPRRFAMTAGMVAMLGAVGAIGGQAPLAAVVAAAGWRESLVWASAFAIALAIAFWLLVPESKGGAGEGSAAGGLRGLGAVARNPQSWLQAGLAFCTATPLFAFASLWGVPFVMEGFGVGRTEAAAATSLFLIGWAIGAPGAGWLSDRIGRRKVPLIGPTAITPAALALVIYVPDLPLGLAQALLFVSGLATGAIVCNMAMVRERNRPEFAATAVAFNNTGVMIAGAVSQPLIGWLLELAWDGRMVEGVPVYGVEAFRVAFLYLAACGIGGAALLPFVRETWCRPLGAEPSPKEHLFREPDTMKN